jgi:hypothetical protein
VEAAQDPMLMVLLAQQILAAVVVSDSTLVEEAVDQVSLLFAIKVHKLQLVVL